jgi:hypothetical protein
MLTTHFLVRTLTVNEDVCALSMCLNNGVQGQVYNVLVCSTTKVASRLGVGLKPLFTEMMGSNPADYMKACLW